jgi:hypothetical protein
MRGRMTEKVRCIALRSKGMRRYAEPWCVAVHRLALLREKLLVYEALSYLCVRP